MIYSSWCNITLGSGGPLGGDWLGKVGSGAVGVRSGSGRGGLLGSGSARGVLASVGRGPSPSVFLVLLKMNFQPLIF